MNQVVPIIYTLEKTFFAPASFEVSWVSFTFLERRGPSKCYLWHYLWLFMPNCILKKISLNCCFHSRLFLWRTQKWNFGYNFVAPLTKVFLSHVHWNWLHSVSIDVTETIEAVKFVIKKVQEFNSSDINCLWSQHVGCIT